MSPITLPDLTISALTNDLTFLVEFREPALLFDYKITQFHLDAVRVFGSQAVAHYN